MSRFLNAFAAAGLIAAPAAAQQIGRPATQEEIAAWNIDVRPDGTGAPEGSGDLATGEEIYMSACSSCHGVFGEGEGRWPVLMGGGGTLDGTRPVKTVGSYWPYLSTVFDYVHRAMPFGAGQSLSDDEVYAVTAYLLSLNDLVDEDFTLSDDNIGEFEMPNRDGFYMDDRAEVELPKFRREACMSDCKDQVEITMHAAVLDVTPEEPAEEAERQAAAAVADDGDSNLAEAAGDIDKGIDAVEADRAGGGGRAAGGDETATGATASGGAGAATGEDADAETSLTMTAADPELVAEGEELFRQCQACHQVGEGAQNGIGPQLNGVIGRTAGGLDDYRYSRAMTEAGKAGLVWDAVSLEEFLADPRGYIQGTKMTFRGLPEEDVAAMVAYLGSLGN